MTAAGYYRSGAFQNDSDCTELRGSAIAGGCCVNVFCTGLEASERTPAAASAEEDASATGGSMGNGEFVAISAHICNEVCRVKWVRSVFQRALTAGLYFPVFGVRSGNEAFG